MTIVGKPTIVSVTRRTAEETSENIRRYRDAMAGQEAIDLLRARGKIVADLRREPHGRQGEVDSRYDRWYRPEHWGVEQDGVCKFEGPEDWFDTLKPDAEGLKSLELEAKIKAEKIAKARAALAGVEERLGVKPVDVPPPVAEVSPQVSTDVPPEAVTTDAVPPVEETEGGQAAKKGTAEYERLKKQRQRERARLRAEKDGTP